MTAYVPLRDSLELCLRKPYDWHVMEEIYPLLHNEYSIEIAHLFALLFTRAGQMKACRIQFFLTRDELRIAYGGRYTFLEAQYHKDMKQYCHSREEYYQAKTTFFDDFDKRGEAA